MEHDGALELKITDTVLIFGRSPFLKTIDVQKFLKLGLTTFGINLQEFETDYVVFVDDSVAKLHNQLKGIVITQSRHNVREPVIYFDNFSYNFTHDYLLKWLNGRCTRAILIGAADFMGHEHYNSVDPFRYTENCKNRSISYIESINEIKILKMNPKSVLNIPQLSIEELAILS